MDQPEPAEPDGPTEVEALAKLLCTADGDNPENFRNGRPRWQHYEFAARQHIAAFEFLAASRGVEGKDLG